MKKSGQRPFDTKSWIWITILFFLWGSTWPIGKIAIGFFSVESLVALRFLSSGFLMTLYLVLSKRISKIPKRVILVALGIGVFQYFLYYLLSYYALMVMDASRASVISSSYPLFTALLTSEFWKEKRSILARLLGFTLGILGVTVSVGYYPWKSGLAVDIKDFIMLSATISLALGSRILKYMEDDVYILEATSIGMIFAGILASLKLSIQGGKLISGSTIMAWAAFTYLVLVGSIFVFLMWNKLIVKNPLLEVASLNYLLPIFGVLSSHILLHEKIGLDLVIGSLLIILGIFIITSKLRLHPEI